MKIVPAVLNPKRPTFWMLWLTVLACVLILLFFIADWLTYGPLGTVRDDRADYAELLDRADGFTVDTGGYTLSMRTADGDDPAAFFDVLKKACVTKMPVGAKGEALWAHTVTLEEQGAPVFTLLFDESCRWMHVSAPNGEAAVHQVKDPAYFYRLFEAAVWDQTRAPSGGSAFVSVEVKSVKLSGDTPTIKVEWKTSNPDGEVIGADFDIERYENGLWKSCRKNKAKDSNASYRFEPDSVTVHTYNLSDFDLSKPGTYRFYRFAGGPGMDIWDAFSVPFMNAAAEKEPASNTVTASYKLNKAWAGFSRDRELNMISAFLAVNDGSQHMPVWRVRSTWSIKAFQDHYRDALDFSESGGGLPSFDEVMAQYDDAWFEDNALLVVYVRSETPYFDYEVESFAVEPYESSKMLTAHIKTVDPEATGPIEPYGCWLILEVDRALLESTEYEAAVLDKYTAPEIPDGLSEDEITQWYSDMLEEFFAKEYTGKLDRKHEEVNAVIEAHLADPNIQSLYRTDPNIGLLHLRHELNGLLPFRSMGSLIGPIAPETYAEARAYVEAEFARGITDSNRDAFESMLDRMETTCGGVPSAYTENPQANFDTARRHYWVENGWMYDVYAGRFG